MSIIALHYKKTEYDKKKDQKHFPLLIYASCMFIFLMEMMNSCFVNVSLVPSLQLDLSLSMDYLAHMKPS
jgi:hypothetical protein